MSDMNEEMTATQEQALDALLSEVHDKGAPPDLSHEILARLSKLPEKPVSPAEIVCSPNASPRRSASTSTPLAKQVTIALSLVAALAASLLLAVWVRQDRQPGSGPGTQLAVNDPEIDNDSIIEPPTTQIAADASPVDPSPEPLAPPRVRPRGIPLVVDIADSMTATTDESVVIAPQAPSSSEPLKLVSADVATDLENYWQAIGIQPSSEATANEISQRLITSLGVELSPQAMGDPESIQTQFDRPGVAHSIARRWLQQITQGGLSRLEQESQEELIAEVAESFQSRKSLDRLLVTWINGENPNGSPFYTAVSVGGENQMVRRLASLTMNVDLRCVQCHDALIEGTGRQHDYWSFAAFLRQGLTRQQGVWTVGSDSSPKPVYYSLLDGIQKVAEPAIASHWLPQAKPITNMNEWSDALAGSQELARGIVNSLWNLVHGQPLQGRVIDTITAPHSESLDRLEQRLTSDLVQSRFDVGRTLALIITSPATRRSVPPALLPENALVASGTEIETAMQSVNAFAAALPVRNNLPTPKRIDVAMQRIGATIDGLPGDSVLAQDPGETSSGSADSSNQSTAARAKPGSDFPGRATSLPVQWLASIKDENSRIEHLGYLAGMSEIPPQVIAAAKSMRAADESGELLLHRVWWLVRP